MADRALSTSRRALLGAAAALPFLTLPTGVCAEVPPEPAEGPVAAPSFPSAADRQKWNDRLARYRTLAATAKEAAETGWFRAANDRYNREMEAIAALGGAAPKAARRTAFRRVDRAEKAYWSRCTKPMQESAVLLAFTPAPDLRALLAKIEVMREQELDELEIAGRPVLEMLAEDVQRLMVRH